MGFSPVECVVRYVGMEDRYTLKHSYVRLPRQESFSKSHRLKPSAPTCYPLYHFWDRLREILILYARPRNSGWKDEEGPREALGLGLDRKHSRP